MEPTSKYAIREARRQLNLTRNVYVNARYMVRRASRLSRYERENFANEALNARFWYYDAKRKLAALEARPVAAHGGRWSPNALKRNGLAG